MKAVTCWFGRALMITPCEILFMASEMFSDDMCRYFLKMGSVLIIFVVQWINQDYVISSFIDTILSFNRNDHGTHRVHGILLTLRCKKI
jgi:hypothetical protein